MKQIACIQMTSGHQISENLLNAQLLIQEAAGNGAQLIVLPENFALMAMDEAEKVKYKETIGEGPIQDFLSRAARENNVWLIGGTIPIAVPDNKNKVFASCLVFNNQGERVARYDKIHLFDVELRATKESYAESKITESGKNVVVIPTPFGKIGLAVCYDIRFPEMFRAMQKEGVEIIAIPTAFTYTTGSAHWDILVRARAIENLSYVITACQTGLHSNNRRTFGHSMVVNPWGEVAICLPEHPGIALAEINLEFLHTLRDDFPALLHRQIRDNYAK